MNGAMRLLLAASISVPALLFGFLGWRSHGETLALAYRHVLQTTAILNENAQKVFEINGTALDRTAEQLSGGLARTGDSAMVLHRFLVRMKESTPSIPSLWVFGADGSTLANSEGATQPEPFCGTECLRLGF